MNSKKSISTHHPNGRPWTPEELKKIATMTPEDYKKINDDTSRLFEMTKFLGEKTGQKKTER